MQDLSSKSKEPFYQFPPGMMAMSKATDSKEGEEGGMRRNWNPCTWLVGKRNSSAAVQGGLEVPPRTVRRNHVTQCLLS